MTVVSVFNACTGHAEVAQWLVEHGGASRTATNNFGCHAMHWAAEGGSVTVGQWLMAKAVHHPSTSAVSCYWHERNMNGHSPLHMAARKGHVEVVHWLMRSDGGRMSTEMLRQKDNDGYSPIALARLECHDELADWMDSFFQ